MRLRSFEMCFFHGISISQELKYHEGTDAALFQDHTWLLEALKELEKKKQIERSETQIQADGPAHILRL